LGVRWWLDLVDTWTVVKVTKPGDKTSTGIWMGAESREKERQTLILPPAKSVGAVCCAIGASDGAGEWPSTGLCPLSAFLSEFGARLVVYLVVDQCASRHKAMLRVLFQGVSEAASSGLGKPSGGEGRAMAGEYGEDPQHRNLGTY
jgi:hypothetical protein